MIRIIMPATKLTCSEKYFADTSHIPLQNNTKPTPVSSSKNVLLVRNFSFKGMPKSIRKYLRLKDVDYFQIHPWPIPSESFGRNSSVHSFDRPQNQNYMFWYFLRHVCGRLFHIWTKSNFYFPDLTSQMQSLAILQQLTSANKDKPQYHTV